MVALITIILLIGIYNLHVHIKVIYIHKDLQNEMLISISILKGLIKYNIKLPDIHLNMKQETLRFKSIKNKQLKEQENKYTFKELKHLIIRSQHLRDKYKNPLQAMIDKIKIKNIIITIEFDTKNAAATGILAGIIYALVTNMFLWLESYKSIDTHQLNVTPLFIQQNSLHMNFSCIITFKLGQVINVGIEILKLYLKGGD